ncbi:hypothetical protein [Mycolicibacterium gadium]|jgi:hypothetical protein|uniref:hypothetical protein n=1 Tax=Mycolicibacterium gadium TaxID=1794 RepID=UPI002FDE71E2
MSGDERQSERYLRMVIELLHGVTLELFDRDGLQNVVDYVFSSPNGDGAVEITTARDGRAAAWFSKLRESDSIDCASERGWTVEVELGTKLAQLKQRLPAVIAACDRHQVDRPDLLHVDDWDADVAWFITTGINLYRSPASQPGTVRVQMPTTVGFPSSEGLDDDLARLMSDAKIATKLSKLRDHPGVTERHLAIGVDWYGPGFNLIDNLLFGFGHLPHYAPPDDFAATHIWLSGEGWDVLTWTRSTGWAWRSLPRESTE